MIMWAAAAHSFVRQVNRYPVNISGVIRKFSNTTEASEGTLVVQHTSVIG